VSTKPVTVPRWANVSGSLITPSSGKLDVGFVTAERPPAQYLNWLLKWNGDWAQYLSDAAFQGASTFNSTLGVTGLITATGGMTAAALITANAGMTAGANQHVTVSGTGRFKHGSKTISVSVLNMISGGTGTVDPITYINNSTTFEAKVVAAANPLSLMIPIDGLENGQRIVNVRIYLKDVNAQAVVTCGLYGGNRANATALTGSTAASANNGTTQTITLSGVNHTVGTTSVGPTYVRMTTAINVTGTYSFYACEIDVDFP
jgi:hypothetical protein